MFTLYISHVVIGLHKHKRGYTDVRKTSNDRHLALRLPDWRGGGTMSYEFWKTAKPVKGTEFGRSFIMILMNRERARLARRIRELERKLGRPHRYLPQCGAVQYV